MEILSRARELPSLISSNTAYQSSTPCMRNCTRVYVHTTYPGTKCHCAVFNHQVHTEYLGTIAFTTITTTVITTDHQPTPPTLPHNSLCPPFLRKYILYTYVFQGDISNNQILASSSMLPLRSMDLHVPTPCPLIPTNTCNAMV